MCPSIHGQSKPMADEESASTRKENDTEPFRLRFSRIRSSERTLEVAPFHPLAILDPARAIQDSGFSTLSKWLRPRAWRQQFFLGGSVSPRSLGSWVWELPVGGMIQGDLQVMPQCGRRRRMSSLFLRVSAVDAPTIRMDVPAVACIPFGPAVGDHLRFEKP